MTRHGANWWASVLLIGSREYQRPPASTAAWWSRATSGHSDSTCKASGARRRRECPDGQPPLDAAALGSVCPCRWGQVLASHQRLASAGCQHGIEHRPVQAVTGAELGEGSAVSVIEHLNSNYLQLGLVALIFGGLQVWWISTTLRKRDLARPLSEGEYRKTLERIWAKKI